MKAVIIASGKGERLGKISKKLLITVLANGYGYEYIFSEELKSFGRSGDIMLIDSDDYGLVEDAPLIIDHLITDWLRHQNLNDGN